MVRFLRPQSSGKESVLVDSWGTVHLVAEWRGAVAGREWEVDDDPRDKDPIVSARWIHWDEALRLDGLGRQRRELLHPHLFPRPFQHGNGSEVH